MSDKASSLSSSLFTYAPRELSHSGYWAWVLASLHEQATPEHQKIQATALAFLQRLDWEPALPLVAVRTEEILPEKAGRIDIYIEDSECRILLIENKVGARLGMEQLSAYQGAIKQYKKNKEKRMHDWPPSPRVGAAQAKSRRT